jgi:glycine cleavage system H protein
MAERRYSETHEWVSVDGKTATVGISDFAQAQLGDIVFLELPRQGEKVSQGQTFGVVESVKAASDLYSPVQGTVVEVNTRASDSPDVVNRDPYGDGWLLRVELEGDVPELMDEAAYQEFTRTEGSAT